MAEISGDLRALEHDVEVLLFCTVGGETVAVLARKHWFPTENPTERREGWQSTWDGKEVPAVWAPYAFMRLTEPDPALFEEGY